MANSDISPTSRHFCSPPLPKEGQFSVCVRSGLSISALGSVLDRAAGQTDFSSINWILDPRCKKSPRLLKIFETLVVGKM